MPKYLGHQLPNSTQSYNLPQNSGVFLLAIRNSYGVGLAGIFICAPFNHRIYYIELAKVEDYFQISPIDDYTFSITSGNADGYVYVLRLT